MTSSAGAVLPDVAAPDTVHRRRTVETVIRIALGLGITLQVAQRFLTSGYDVSEYGRSLWYVHYEFGFVRRGLAGELLRAVVGGTPSLQTVDLVQNVVALLMLASATALVVLLCRQRTVIGYAAAALIVVAPFGFDSVGGQRRPDLIGFMLLACVGIWAATRPVRSFTLAAVAGVLLAVSALVSEVSPLIVGPWLVVVVVATARARGESVGASWCAASITCLPSILALGVLVRFGQASTAKVDALERIAPPGIAGHGSVFSYLDDTFRRSVGRVIVGPSRLALSIVFGVLLVGIVLFCARAALPYARAAFEWIFPSRPVRAAWTAAMLAGAAVLFGLGLDTLRWITSFAFAGLLAAGAIVVLTARAPFGPPGRDRWRRAVPSLSSFSVPTLVSVLVALYLLLLPPLPNWIRSPGEAARLLLDVPA